MSGRAGGAIPRARTFLSCGAEAAGFRGGVDREPLRPRREFEKPDRSTSATLSQLGPTFLSIPVLPHAHRAENMSSAQEPLIANPDAGDDHDRDGYADADDDEESATLQKQADESAPGLFIWLLACSAGISGLLFGCECPSPGCSVLRPDKR